jgi:hypothetical protein
LDGAKRATSPYQKHPQLLTTLSLVHGIVLGQIVGATFADRLKIMAPQMYQVEL